MALPGPAQHNPPKFIFEIDDSLEPWNMSARAWLTKHDKHWDGLATANAVFNEDGKVLLVQRASHDSMPNRWELPGGAADEDDPNLLYAAARELWEESGLVAKRFNYIIADGPDGKPGHIFTNRTGQRIFCRFAFDVDVESCQHVKLDPNEHQDFLWATEDEVKKEKIGDRDIPITHPSMSNLILKAFRARKDKNETS